MHPNYFPGFRAIAFLLICAAGISCAGCQKKSNLENEQNALDIDEYIQGLQYNANEILNVQATGGQASVTTLTDSKSDPATQQGGYDVTCTRKEYNLQSNFEDVAILRPTNGIVFPGALVYGDSSMLDGAPTPLPIKRAPLKLRIDLPGMGDQGNITVDNPDNGTVQAKIDDALQWWNNNAYQEGYVNPSYISYKTTTSYSSQQLALDLGLNVAWAGNDVSAQFSYTSSTTKKVAMMSFKQGFYSVTMNTPLSPSEVFSPEVTLEKVEAVINNSTPPAYVHSVVYGRIIMFRMESTLQVTSADLELALKYATGVTNVTGTNETHIKNILSNSTTTVVTIGGNAAVASEAVSAKSFGDLEKIIKGQNAVYNKSNPGVPIAYTIRYLKNNTLAKMGYTTDYSVYECSKKLLPAATLSLFCEAGYVNRFKVTYKDANGVSKSHSSGDVPLGVTKKFTVPAGSYSIKMDVDYHTGLGWHDQKEFTFGRPTKKCYKTWGTVFSPQIGTVTCN